MSSSKAPRYLQHIIENARSVFHYTEGMDLSEFEEDRKTYDAVERCLQRISEAVIRLADDAPELLPNQPLHRIRGFGNRLRHNYDNIEEDIIFDIVRNHLPSLCAAADAALQNLRGDKAPRTIA